jgi:hypothetical protein
MTTVTSTTSIHDVALKKTVGSAAADATDGSKSAEPKADQKKNTIVNNCISQLAQSGFGIAEISEIFKVTSQSLSLIHEMNAYANGCQHDLGSGSTLIDFRKFKVDPGTLLQQYKATCTRCKDENINFTTCANTFPPLTGLEKYRRVIGPF